MDAKAEEKIFVGYCQDSKSYRLLDPITHKIVRSRDVIFLEESKVREKERMAETYLPVLENVDEGEPEERAEEEAEHESNGEAAEKAGDDAISIVSLDSDETDRTVMEESDSDKPDLNEEREADSSN